jgi:Uma2 family endonuclease
MIAILESPDIRRRALPINVATYHWMIENGMVSSRAELIRGVVVERPRKTPMHVFLAHGVYDCLKRTLSDDWLVRLCDPITLPDSEPEPDVSVVRGSKTAYLDSHPRTAALTVEVADVSEASDREMISAYAEAGVEECWLVLATTRVIEVYTAPQNGAYTVRRTLGVSDTLTATALPGVSLEIGSLFPAQQ